MRPACAATTTKSSRTVEPRNTLPATPRCSSDRDGRCARSAPGCRGGTRRRSRCPASSRDRCVLLAPTSTSSSSTTRPSCGTVTNPVGADREAEPLLPDPRTRVDIDARAQHRVADRGVRARPGSAGPSWTPVADHRTRRRCGRTALSRHAAPITASGPDFGRHASTLRGRVDHGRSGGCRGSVGRRRVEQRGDLRPGRGKARPSRSRRAPAGTRAGQVGRMDDHRPRPGRLQQRRIQLVVEETYRPQGQPSCSGATPWISAPVRFRRHARPPAATAANGVRAGPPEKTRVPGTCR